MEIERLAIPEVIVIKIIKHEDDRGFFSETYNQKDLSEAGININFNQDNHAFSVLKGTVRGLHFQNEPFAQSKLVSVQVGKILDVAVDIRKDSETYGKYFSYILSSEMHESVFIPKGFAHGYLTLSRTAVVNYLVDNYYNKLEEDGISFEDEFLNINWGIKTSKIICSKKDKELKSYRW